MAFIIFRNYYFRISIKNLTKCNSLKTFAFKNNEKFVDHNLEKFCFWSLVLAPTIPVLGLVVAESIVNIFCPCAIMSAVSGCWHISLIAMGGIA